MSDSAAPRSASSLVTWLGLLWVWSGAVWLYALLAGHGDRLALLGRLAGTLWIGIGLCALERWAWAAALCLAGFYATAGAAMWAAISLRLATMPPTTLSWMPAVMDLSVLDARSLSRWAALVSLGAGAVSTLLWRERAGYDVPHRLGFTYLVRKGLAFAAAVVAADVVLLIGWWLEHRLR